DVDRASRARHIRAARRRAGFCAEPTTGLESRQVALARAVRAGLLRHRDDGRLGLPLRYRPLWLGVVPPEPAAGGPDDRRRPGVAEDGAGAARDLRPDARPKVGGGDGRLRLLRWRVQ